MKFKELEPSLLAKALFVPNGTSVGLLLKSSLFGKPLFPVLIVSDLMLASDFIPTSILWLSDTVLVNLDEVEPKLRGVVLLAGPLLKVPPNLLETGSSFLTSIPGFLGSLPPSCELFSMTELIEEEELDSKQINFHGVF